MSKKRPTSFPLNQDSQLSQHIARSDLPFRKRESLTWRGRGGRFRGVRGGGGAAGAAGAARGGGGATGALEGLGLAAGGARRGAVANVGGDNVRPVADGDTERRLADEEASVVWCAAKGASSSNASKDSQTGQTFPLQGWIAGITCSIMIS